VRRTQDQSDQSRRRKGPRYMGWSVQDRQGGQRSQGRGLFLRGRERVWYRKRGPFTFFSTTSKTVKVKSLSGFDSRFPLMTNRLPHGEYLFCEDSV